MVAPSAKSLHPVEYVIVRDKKKLERLSECGSFQRFIKNASVVIVVVADPVKSDRFWRLDATLAAAHIYLETTNQGLGTCWAHVLEGKNEKGEDREDLVRKNLDIPAEKRILCLFPIGYPDEKAPDHSEAEYDENKVHQEEW
jgi:nitroreductase